MGKKKHVNKDRKIAIFLVSLFFGTLILYFQNCADQSQPGSGLFNSSNGSGPNPFGSPTPSPSPSSGALQLVISKVTLGGPLATAFNCPADTMYISVSGGGSNVEGCLGVQTSDTNSACDANSTYVNLASAPNWKYNQSKDTWSNIEPLLNNANYVPGTYAPTFRISGRSNSMVSATFSIVRNDGGSNANCILGQVPNCANHGQLGSFPDLATLTAAANANANDSCVTLEGFPILTDQPKFGPCIPQVCNP